MRSDLYFESIEDYLGPAATRFFAAGYRRASHRIGEVRLSAPHADSPGAEANITVEYPRDWSKKTDEMDLPPHLSTVDMIVLGAQLAEAHLSHAYNLDAAARRRMRLRRVTLKSGTTPQEELAALPSSATLRSTRELEGAADHRVSSYRCKIGVMQARFEIEHEVGSPAINDASHASIDEVLDPPEDRYYGTGFKAGRHAIEDMHVDIEALVANAVVHFSEASDSTLATGGIDGACQPSVSLIDCFVVNLQMAQVLMYEMDSMKRQDSDTLWMLRTRLDAPDAPQNYEGSMPARAEITAKYLLELDGHPWRNADIAGECGGVALRCSFAHRLPEQAGDAAVTSSAS